MSLWNWNPIIGFILAFSMWRYMDGVWTLWAKAGVNKGVSRWNVAVFWTGIAALRSEVVHIIEHVSFLLTAILFWWVVPIHHSYRKLGYGVGFCTSSVLPFTAACWV